MTKSYFWRATISGAVYVDSNSGDDINGSGTQQNPYQTLGRAYRGSASKPGTIVCRGFFSEDMADGNHACTIIGEYPGAAVFDGKDTYTIYGFTISNMIVNNCIPGNSLTTVYTNNPLFAGVGRAHAAGYVGIADYSVYFPGFSGSNCIFKNCGHYFGHIGGQGNRNVISNPKHNDTYKLFLWGNSGSTYWCIHGVKKEDRTLSKNSTAGGNNFFKSIFTDVAFYINDHITFSGCYFGNDCTWWNNKTGEQIVIEGNTSEEKIAFLQSKMTELGAANTNCKFIDCTFLDKNASEIYNNPELGDFTTKLDSGIPASIGAFGPALNIPIKNADEFTTGGDLTNTWNPFSATNNLAVENNQIVLVNTDNAEIGDSSICTGLISIDVDRYNLRSLFTEIASKFNKQIIINDKEVTGARYNPSTVLPLGKYIVRGSITYNGIPFTDGDILTVTVENTQFLRHSEATGDVYIVELTNPNIEILTYIRGFSTFLEIHVNKEHTLLEDRVYVVLDAPADIVTDFGKKLYKGSIIDNQAGKIQSTSYIKLGTLNTVNSEWCPCKTWGDVFIVRDGNNIAKDADGIPLSSGNPNCYNSNGSVKPGYNGAPLNYKYQQFKIVARKVC